MLFVVEDRTCSYTGTETDRCVPVGRLSMRRTRAAASSRVGPSDPPGPRRLAPIERRRRPSLSRHRGPSAGGVASDEAWSARAVRTKS
eukprot:3570892-Prymnesium_polylepis.3